MSKISVGNIGYRTISIVKNGNTPILANKPLRVEPISPVSSNIKYDRNNPNNGNDFTFARELEKAIKNQEDVELEKRGHVDIKI